MHIPKSGGSSIRRYIKSHFDTREIFPELKLHHFPEFGSLQVVKERIFLGHLGKKFVNASGAASVTVLRHPVERLLSLYSYFLNPGNGMPLIDINRVGYMGIEEFFSTDRPEILMNVDNAQVWQVGYGYSPGERMEFLQNEERPYHIGSAAVKALVDCAVVGTVESLDYFFDRFDDFMGVTPKKSAREKIRMNKSVERIRWSDLNKMQKALVESRCELEWSIYELAKNL